MRLVRFSLASAIAMLATGLGSLSAQEILSRDALKEADYMAGKLAFQGRCSACHTLADNSMDLTGPNLWGVFCRKPAYAGRRINFWRLFPIRKGLCQITSW
jgi:cytochrome c2